MSALTMTALMAFTLTVAWVLGLRPIAERIGLVDQPGAHKTHRHPTPLVGGLAIYATLVVLAVAAGDALALGLHSASIALVAPLVLLGAADDHTHIAARYRFMAQIAVALTLALFTGVHIASFGDLLGLGDLSLGLLALPVTVLAFVGAINATNMSDGLDGLSGSLAAITLSAIALLAWLGSDTATLTFAAMLLGAVFAHLAFNLRVPGRPRALIFLGDAGSMTIGLLLAYLLVHSAQGPGALIAPVAALWLFALPLIDLFVVMERRIRRGVPPFHPGQDHLHHDLRNAGLTVGQSVAVLATVHLSAVATGLVATHLGAPDWAMFAGVLTLHALVRGVANRSRHRSAPEPTAAPSESTLSPESATELVA